MEGGQSQALATGCRGADPQTRTPCAHLQKQPAAPAEIGRHRRPQHGQKRRGPQHSRCATSQPPGSPTGAGHRHVPGSQAHSGMVPGAGGKGTQRQSKRKRERQRGQGRKTETGRRHADRQRKKGTQRHNQRRQRGGGKKTDQEKRERPREKNEDRLAEQDSSKVNVSLSWKSSDLGRQRQGGLKTGSSPKKGYARLRAKVSGRTSKSWLGVQGQTEWLGGRMELSLARGRRASSQVRGGW